MMESQKRKKKENPITKRELNPRPSSFLNGLTTVLGLLYLKDYIGLVLNGAPSALDGATSPG